jgi:transposase
LYFEQGLTKEEIADLMEVSTNFVVKWTESPEQDFQKDDRGWQKGRRRKWDKETVRRVGQIREDLREDPDEKYWGATAIEAEYRRRFPDQKVPPVRTIGQILSDMGVTENQENSSSRGALRYLHYPQRTFRQILWNRLGEADFLGDKFITGRTEPLHFIGYSLKSEPRLRHYERVAGETTDEFIRTTQQFFSRFEKPEALKMDNAAATIGSSYYRRTISQVMEFLLGREVYPVFSVPRTPATQASIEGSNSVFVRKFWNQEQFQSIAHVDERLRVFNESTRKYLGYEVSQNGSQKSGPFIPKAYFLRQVTEQKHGNGGSIDVLHEQVELPPEYIKYFVLAEWNLEEEKLLVRFEEREESQNGREESVTSRVIKQTGFPIHEASKKRCHDLLS